MAASDLFKEDVKVQMNDMALSDWLMRIVNVSGLSEEALTSGGSWIDEIPAAQDQADGEKKPITGVSL